MKEARNEDAAVLVVGAGPTGLTLATILARYGVDVRIVERNPSLSRHTKATNLMQRNQEVLHALGLLDALAARSGRMTRLMVHAYGKCFGPRTMHVEDSPFADVLLCGQHNYEEVAADGLRAEGVDIEFGVELIGLVQDANGATATLASDGATRTARFAFVVGRDGAVGATRRFTRHDFRPAKTGVAIRQVDCRLYWRRLSTMDQMWLFYFDHGFSAVVPLPGGVHRILTVEPKSAFPQREPTLAEMEGKLREIADDPSLVLTDADWFSYTDLSMGIAPGLRDGRVLLAGDSGNPVLPNGGQGMNTGIADAFNLGWKLAALLRHKAPIALLDTYEEERLALRRTLQKAQFNSLRYTTLVTPKIMQAAFRRLVEPMLDRGGERAMARAFSELAIHTRRSPLSVEGVRSGGVRAGDRALDAAVSTASASVRLYDLVYRGAWTLLAFGGRMPRNDAASTLDAVRNLGRPDLAAFVISPDGRLDGSIPILFDLDEEAHRVYAIDRPTLLLIRPDGHMAVRVPPSQVGKVRAYLERWLPDASQAFGVRRIEAEDEPARAA